MWWSDRSHSQRRPRIAFNFGRSVVSSPSFWALVWPAGDRPPFVRTSARCVTRPVWWWTIWCPALRYTVYILGRQCVCVVYMCVCVLMWSAPHARSSIDPFAGLHSCMYPLKMHALNITDFVQAFFFQLACVMNTVEMLCIIHSITILMFLECTCEKMRWV
jgi:hypothetical protein